MGWFDPDAEPFGWNGRVGYQDLVWRFRYSGIEVPDRLWRRANVGVGKLDVDGQAQDLPNEREALAAFHEWTDALATDLAAVGRVPDTSGAEAHGDVHDAMRRA